VKPYSSEDLLATVAAAIRGGVDGQAAVAAVTAGQ
jgi:hypothetical protein